MTDENAINFLLYSYFEITLASTEEDILIAAINRAYRDASSRVLSIDDDNQRDTLKCDAAKKLCVAISSLWSTTNYEMWFYDTCEQLEETYENTKGKKQFCFGHAQKWVNMTMKYLYVIKSIFYQYRYGKDMFPQLTDALEKQLHIPVDSYIMEAVASTKTAEKPYGLGIQLPSTKEGKLVSYTSAKAWSTWKKCHYEKFREEMEGKIAEDSPLDWEGPAWIEIAKARKAKAQKKASDSSSK